MLTKELLKTQIDQLDNQHLETLHQLIQSLKTPVISSQPNLMEKLSTVKISAPHDFAENLTHY
jgi:hypothetical protein